MVEETKKSKWVVECDFGLKTGNAKISHESEDTTLKFPYGC